ncbi:MAG: DUF4445 domain-containing protein [Clostridia bacterium]|nr:DUF4445 domain-containing protein [Clostridia bacterium]
MLKVVFRFENEADKEIFASENENLLEVARRANVAIDAPCSGNGSCGKCKVKLIEGELESPKSRHISEEDYAAGWRLACNSKLLTDVVIGIPDIASAYKSRMKTADLSTGAEVRIFEEAKQSVIDADIPFINSFASAVITLDAPTLDDTMPDIERLERALQAEFEVDEVIIPHCVMITLPSVLRESNWSVRCCGRHDGNIYELMTVAASTDTTPMCGVAIDIGTTTVTAVLTDLENGRLLAKGSAGNGQIRYGADVINRIIESTRPGGKKKLQDAIIKETLDPLLKVMCKQAGVKAENVLSMAVAANTTMNHLFVGVDAESVRMEPYIPSFFAWEGLLAGDLKLPANPLAPVIIAPNIGSYVGGDITAGTLMTMMWDRDEMSIFIDLGTNGEIVFGNRDFLMSCACSAGPAFEGGDISCGMRATDGAIEACTIDRETMEPSFSVIGEAGQKPVGLCGSGIIDVIAELFRCGIISAKGQSVREGKRVSKDTNDFDCYVLAFADESETGRNITINTVDIDNFIRAKGAIFSAICTMMTSLDMDVSCIEHMYVAGGIGSGINMKNAVRIGMFPDIDLDLFTYIGNSSLAGAYAMVMSDMANDKVEELAQTMTYIELSTTPGYMDEFMAACFLPHTNADLFPSCQEME